MFVLIFVDVSFLFCVQIMHFYLDYLFICVFKIILYVDLFISFLVSYCLAHNMSFCCQSHLRLKIFKIDNVKVCLCLYIDKSCAKNVEGMNYYYYCSISNFFIVWSE